MESEQHHHQQADPEKQSTSAGADDCERAGVPASSSGSLVALGVLFNSFEELANYEAKKAELRRLGMFVDEDLPSAERRSGMGRVPQSSALSSSSLNTIPLPLSTKGTLEDPSTITTLRRQIEHRDAISSLISAKSADEAEQYNNIISALRSEIHRRDQVSDDRNASLSAQVEALRCVLDRKRDADSDAIVKYSDVEEQCKENLGLWQAELSRRLDNVRHVGEQSLMFINGLVKRCEEYAVSEQVDPLENSVRKDLDVIKNMMSETTRVKVTLLQGRLRPVLTAESLSKLRLVYSIGPGQVSDEVASMLAEEMHAEITQLNEEILAECSALVRRKLEAGSIDAASYSPVYLQQELERLRSELKRHSNARGESVAAAKRHHTADALAEVKRIRQRCAERREAEERCLREKVVELTKLVTDQRAATHALRSQLVSDINISRPMSFLRSPNSASKRSGDGDGSFRRVNSTATGLGSRRQSQNLQRRESKSRFDPLSEAQIHDLYGSLASERTLVEEVPVEELASMARYGRTQRVGDGNFIPVKRKSTASLLKQPQQQQTPGTSKQPAPKVSDAASSQQQFSNHELATLKELRRLRTKVIGK